MSQLVFGFWEEKEIYRPSRLQLEAYFASSEWKSSVSPPWPRAGFSKRSCAPPRSELNTILPPSGDQVGRKLFPAPRVKRELTPRARSRVQTSALPLRASARL